jgi:hypothetical protein
MQSRTIKAVVLAALILPAAVNVARASGCDVPHQSPRVDVANVVAPAAMKSTTEGYIQ